MKNFEYGEFLYQLRSNKDYTQRYVGAELGVTDKAVSKWERGDSKPSLEQLKSLAVLYDVPLNELLEFGKKENNISVSKIVLTGGPCAGKTTALTWINNYFTKRGYMVLFVSEVATELISNGLSPLTSITNYEYQVSHMKLQKSKEKIFEEAAKKMKKDKVLIVCDRGILDNKAYMKDIEFKKLMKEFNTSEIKERDSYDAVFHLVTAAKGKEEVYTLANNKARTESINEARILDDKIISAWTGHPHFRVIDNSTDFDKKLERLLKEISNFLGEPEPYEIERKFLINYPNIKELEKMPNCQKVDIVQTYLKCDEGSERRIRARGIDNEYIYYLTEKKKISDLKRIEVERRLTKDEYFNLLMEADLKLRPIQKTRYCLTENNQYFEIDIYPEWDNKAIMEIELSREDEVIKIPEYINVIKEVTNDTRYKNYNMAIDMPKD